VTPGDDVDDDRALLAAHVAGDADAFAELVRRHRDRLWAVALRTTGDREEASDAVQDGLISAFRRAETFRGEMANGDCLSVIELGADSARLRQEKRLVGRLMCPGCGEIYNRYSRVPKQDKVCDVCGRGLVQRSDDREDLILERFRTYREETYPLVQFYQNLGVYHLVDGMRPINEVTNEILEIVDQKKKVLTSVVNERK